MAIVNKFFVVISGFFLTFLLCPHLVFAGDHTKLIVHQAGGRWIYPSDIKNNKTFIENNREFLDGTTVVSNCNVMSSIPLSESTARNNLLPVSNLNSPTLKHMFAFILNANPGPLDNDAVWAQVAQNWATLAKVTKEYGLVGIVFDNEEYGSSWSNYPSYCPDQCSKSRANGGCQGFSRLECQALVVARGKQVMEAVKAVFPNVVVLTFHGPSVSDPNSTQYGFPSWSAYHEFKGPFFFGFVKGMGLLAKNVDGGESNYNFRTVEQFAKAYQYQKYDITNLADFMPNDLKSSYSNRVSVSYGIYDGYGQTPSTYETTIYNALNQADDYIWLYLEGRSLVHSGGASEDWVNAVRTAKNQYMGSLPTTTPPSKLGDANNDGRVTIADYIIWLNHYGMSTGNGPKDGDFDNSGSVGIADYIIWLNNYGT